MFWGAGIGYETPLRDDLLEAIPELSPELLSIVPRQFFGCPGELDALAERWPLVMHCGGASVGTVGSPPAPWVAAVAELVSRARPLLLSERLAMTRSPDGLDLGHPAPLWLTDDQLDVATANIEHLQRALGVPVAIQNVPATFQLAPADYEEPEFFAELTRRTRCGVHLDLDALVTTAHNFGEPAAARLDRYPLDRVWLVAVGVAAGDEVSSLLASLRGRAHVRGILVQGEGNARLDEQVTEARRARRIWTDGSRAHASGDHQR